MSIINIIITDTNHLYYHWSVYETYLSIYFPSFHLFIPISHSHFSLLSWTTILCDIRIWFWGSLDYINTHAVIKIYSLNQGSLFPSHSVCGCLTQSLWEGNAGNTEAKPSGSYSESQIQTLIRLPEWHPTLPSAAIWWAPALGSLLSCHLLCGRTPVTLSQ